MFLAALLVGLREGLEVALVVGLLIAYIRKLGRGELRRPIWLGIGAAVVLSLALGAFFTFGRYGLSFQAQEIIGGSMSLLAVVLVTGMAFWMMSAGSRVKAEVEGNVDRALLVGGAASIFWIAFVTAAREGIETTLMLYGWLDSALAIVGAFTGLLVSAGLGYLLYRGMLKFDLGKFFTWSGAFLIVMSAGILAYGIHDLQEAGVLPGPFSGGAITPIDPATGNVLVGFEAFPFGWAFDVQNVIEPSGFLAALLKGTIGFAPQMSWLEVIAWVLYIGITLPLFIRLARRNRKAALERKALKARQAAASEGAATSAPALPAASAAPITS
ncbi:iron uptake transporter permease EfeU [Gulosibacter molinativorax]|uniref:High-affinity Fe2+/Pb2+ permease n=1 Tax=Gulosibacter molinativorax TaxID=256821 RepID=A0ABT7C977_9MICO|nr:iron uptake transporter permease EfeU [Gulosibacter molinativorax]MDJ1371191.1 high-affinity Fe2+/Pb2+ permease [Gulosibacter molinativorax]QUY63006.1 Ferrous iron permease EfeU [Gulosibacter molinativorax]